MPPLDVTRGSDAEDDVVISDRIYTDLLVDERHAVCERCKRKDTEQNRFASYSSSSVHSLQLVRFDGQRLIERYHAGRRNGGR